MIKINRGGPSGNRATSVQRTEPTQQQLKQMRSEVIRLIAFAGGPKFFSEEIGIPVDTIGAWRKRGRIPQYIAATIDGIERFRSAGFSKESLRPDVTEWDGKACGWEVVG